MYKNLRVPILKFLIPYCIGIALAKHFEIPATSLLLLPLTLLIWFYNRHLAIYAFSIFSFLFLSWSINAPTVVAQTLPFDEKLHLNVSCDAIRKQTKDQVQIETKVLNQKIILYGRKTSPFTIAPGDKLQCSNIKITPLDTTHQVFGAYQKYLLSKGIVGQGFVKLEPENRTKEGTSLSSFLYRFRALTIKKIESKGILSKETAGIFFALVLGEKSFLKRADKEAYKNSGVIHVLAISGLHVGIIYLFLRLLFFWGPKRTTGFQLMVTILVLLCYAILAGNTPSVLRATLMCILIQVGNYRHEDSSSLNVVLCTAFLLLLCEGEQLYDVGFQLSFAAVISIVFSNPQLKRLKGHLRFLPRWKLKSISFIVDLTYLSVAAFIGTFPLLLYHFQAVQVGSIWNSIVVVPLITVAVLAGALVVCLQWQNELTSFLLQLEQLILNVCNHYIEASNSWGQIVLYGAFSSTSLLAFYLLILLLLWPHESWRNKLVLCAFSLTITLHIDLLWEHFYS